MGETGRERHKERNRFLAEHRAHDYNELVRRWRLVVKRAGLRMEVLTRADGFPVYLLRGRRSSGDSIYVSAGIHGDEPAAPWGLLSWAERRAEELADKNLVMLPCLNPWGLICNQRGNAAGEDLNRIFDQSVDPVGALRRFLAGRSFSLAVCLHEDFDGRGIYLYDLNRNGDPHSARTLLTACGSPHMPIDLRAKIDGRKAAEGVIYRRRLDLRRIPGMPEAVFLHFSGHAERTLTFETPSEYDLFERVEAHGRFLDLILDGETGKRANSR